MTGASAAGVSARDPLDRSNRVCQARRPYLKLPGIALRERRGDTVPSRTRHPPRRSAPRLRAVLPVPARTRQCRPIAHRNAGRDGKDLQRSGCDVGWPCRQTVDASGASSLSTKNKEISAYGLRLPVLGAVYSGGGTANQIKSTPDSERARSSPAKSAISGYSHGPRGAVPRQTPGVSSAGSAVAQVSTSGSHG